MTKPKLEEEVKEAHFDKEAYWERRSAGRRGQGEKPFDIVGVVGGDTVNIGIRQMKKDARGRYKGSIVQGAKQALWGNLKDGLRDKQRKAQEAIYAEAENQALPEKQVEDGR